MNHVAGIELPIRHCHSQHVGVMNPSMHVKTRLEMDLSQLTPLRRHLTQTTQPNATLLPKKVCLTQSMFSFKFTDQTTPSFHWPHYYCLELALLNGSVVAYPIHQPQPHLQGSRTCHRVPSLTSPSSSRNWVKLMTSLSAWMNHQIRVSLDQMKATLSSSVQYLWKLIRKFLLAFMNIKLPRGDLQEVPENAF